MWIDRRLADWVASRTPHPHTPPGIPGVRLINAVRFDGWFGGMD